MAKLDERAKAELYKINQEKFFISAIIIAVFLISKIYLQVDIWGLLGELTAACVMLVYLVPYFVIRRRYQTIDEMVKNKLYKLSTAFFIAEMLSLLPVLVLHLCFIFKVFGKPMHPLASSFLFIVTLAVITNAYGLIRRYNETFASQKAAETPLSAYKKRLLIKAGVATAGMVLLIVTFALINHLVIGDGNESSMALAQLKIAVDTGILFCVLGIPAAWFMYAYFLGRRKQLAKKLQHTDESERASVSGKKKPFFERTAVNGVLFFIFLFAVSMTNSMLQGDDYNIWLAALIYAIGLAVYMGIVIAAFAIQKRNAKKDPKPEGPAGEDNGDADEFASVDNDGNEIDDADNFAE